MNDASGTDGSGLDQDHMGNLVESILRSLGGILDECFGTTEGQAEEPYSNGQFDGVIGHCEMYLEDFGDGIQDGDEKLSSWRPKLATVQQVIAAPTRDSAVARGHSLLHRRLHKPLTRPQLNRWRRNIMSVVEIK